MTTPTSKVQNLSGNNFVIVVALISLLVVGVSGLAAKALYESIRRDIKVVSAKSKADKQLKENLEAAPQLVDDYKNLGTKAVLLDTALPSKADFPSLIVMLENMSITSGVKLKSVAPAQVATTEDAPAPAGEAAASGGAASGGGTPTSGSSSQAPTPQTYPFTIAFDGSYDSLLRLLEAVEFSARPMRVVGIQLNGSSGVMSGQIDIETYYQDKATLPFGTETIK